MKKLFLFHVLIDFHKDVLIKVTFMFARNKVRASRQLKKSFVHRPIVYIRTIKMSSEIKESALMPLLITGKRLHKYAVNIELCYARPAFAHSDQRLVISISNKG